MNKSFIIRPISIIKNVSDMKDSYLLLLFAVVFVFTSCTNSSEKKVVTVPEKNISQIIVQGNENGHEYSYRYTLDYDDLGRIVSAEPDHADIFGVTRCEYGNNAFRIYKGDSGISCLLNDKGFIKSAEDDYFDELLVGKMSYNANNQLISIVVDTVTDQVINCVWKNNDMVELNLMGEKIDFLYTEFENKNRLGFLMTIDKENCTIVFPYYKLLGEPSKHLPLSIGQGDERIVYDYVFDDDGYILKMSLNFELINSSKLIHYSFIYGD